MIKTPEDRQSGAEIEITPKMIEAGVLAMSSFDSRFEPEEVAVVRIFRAVLGTASPKIGAKVVLAPDVERYLSPYLESEEGTLSC